MKIRKRYNFTGDVQGVGFRFRAYHAAQQLGITGWVENEPDGSVTIEAQGDGAALAAMLGMMENGLYIDIADISETSLEPDEDELGFDIRP
jgi:acylphosphatase